MNNFDPNTQIAIIWSIEDVHSLDYGLTDAQAWDVLVVCKDNHDATRGITWETLEWAIEWYYPDQYLNKPREEEE